MRLVDAACERACCESDCCCFLRVSFCVLCFPSCSFVCGRDASALTRRVPCRQVVGTEAYLLFYQRKSGFEALTARRQEAMAMVVRLPVSVVVRVS